MASNPTWLGIDIGASSAKLALLHTPAQIADGPQTPVVGRSQVGRSPRPLTAQTAVPCPTCVGRRLVGAHPPGSAALGQSGRYDRPTLKALGAAVRGEAETMLDRAGLVTVAGIGLAVPGPVDDRGVVLQCGNLPALDGVDGGAWVREVLRAVISGGTPVCVMTDTAAAAVGEWSADPKPGRTLYLALGTGVGGAVLDDGRPLTFTRGTPGHLGHLDISGGDAAAPSTPAAGRGAAEAYLGAPALRAAGLPLEDPDACAQHPAMENALNALARTLRITLALYRMDHIVLLGGVAPIFAPHVETLKHRVADGLTKAAPERWTLGVGETGLHTAAIGAAWLARHHHR